MQIIEKELAELREYENNPRNNDEAVEAVAESIKQFGFKVPIVIDNKNVIVCGHTRLKAAERLGLSFVPCIVADDLNDEQIKAFRLADNKTGELAEWDFEALEKELAELTAFDVDMTAFGFDESIFEETLTADEDDFDVEAEVEEIVEPTTKQGEVWQLGRHRLICGDSTDGKTIERLMGKERADLLLIDPPYNVAYESSDGKTIQNDDMEKEEFLQFLTQAFDNACSVMKNGAAFYIWHASREQVNFENALNKARLEIRQQLIWNKNALIIGRQDYQWKHEPCFYGWKEGAPHYFTNSRCETTVIEDKPNINKMSKEELKDYIKELQKNIPASTVINEDKPLRNGDHPTMKPIKLLGYQIGNSSRQGELVLDIFGGSGSTLIACEQLNRVCYMCELDTKYCDVIIKRWENLTGQKAERIESA